MVQTVHRHLGCYHLMQVSLNMTEFRYSHTLGEKVLTPSSCNIFFWNWKNIMWGVKILHNCQIKKFIMSPVNLETPPLQTCIISTISLSDFGFCATLSISSKSNILVIALRIQAIFYWKKKKIQTSAVETISSCSLYISSSFCLHHTPPSVGTLQLQHAIYSL